VARYVQLGQATSKPASNLSAGSEASEGAKPATILSTGSDLLGARKPATNLSTGSDSFLGANAASNLSAGKPGPESLCEKHRETIKKKLELGLTAQRIWQDLVVEDTFGGGYASVKRFVRRLGEERPECV